MELIKLEFLSPTDKDEFKCSYDSKKKVYLIEFKQSHAIIKLNNNGFELLEGSFIDYDGFYEQKKIMGYILFRLLPKPNGDN